MGGAPDQPERSQMVDDLLEYERLTFVPRQGVFDVDSVAAAIGGIGFPFRDEADRAMFVVSPDAGSRDVFLARRREDPESAFPYVLLIDAKPDEITVWPSHLPGVPPLASQFVHWLLATTPCRISNDEGNELAGDGPPER